MDCKKWEDVVVSWVNCLKLSTPVSNLKHLRNGLFFTEIIKILKPSDLEYTTDNCITSHILKFLGTEYPNFALDSENIKDLEDLSELDLLAIASLLLHFSCVLDRKDVLTSPLCHRLPKNIQIQIRSYLENMNKEIVKKDFFQLIDMCIGKSQNTESLNYYRSYHESNTKSRSPLQELLLQTPIKHRSFARDKELKKLRAEIELEQFEKSDLQDELKCQQSKNIKLNKQVLDKSAEIMRLRSEIAILEARTLPTDEDHESAELQRQLHGEINSLEQYVSKLQDELCELYNERDVIKEKLRKAESQCTIWKEKSTLTEQEFDNVIERYRQQEIELNYLRSHCNELDALLEEVRASNRPNETCMEDYSMIDGLPCLQGSEDLACAVVEVQLRDVQKDNIELKNMLKECRENSSKLQQELTDVKEKFEKLESDYQTMQTDNDNLITKVSELTEAQSALCDTREELEIALGKVTELSVNNSALTENINLLHLKVSETNTLLLNVEARSRCMCSEIESLQHKNNAITHDLKDKSDSYDIVQEQMKLLQLKYDSLLEEYNKVDYNFKSVTLNFDKYNAEVEQSLLNLEQLVFGADNYIDMNEKKKAFEKIFLKLECNTVAELENKKVLMGRIDWFEELNRNLRNDIVVLEEKEVVSLQERRQLYDNINNAEIKVKLLEDTIKHQVTRIEDLKGTIVEMCTTIKELKILKRIVEQKQLVISDLEQVNDSLQNKLRECNEELDEYRATQIGLRKQLENSERIKGDFEIKIAEMCNKLYAGQEDEQRVNQAIAELHALNNVFENEVSDITEELCRSKGLEGHLVKSIHDLEISKASLERQIVDANMKIERKKSRETILENELFEHEKKRQLTIKDLNLKIERHTRQIQELELDLHNSRFSCAAAENDLRLLQITRDQLVEQINLCKTDFSKRVAAVEGTKKKLQEDLELAIRDALDIQDQLLKKSNEYDEIKVERDKIAQEYLAVQQHLCECKNKICILDDACKSKDDLLSKSTQDLLVMKLDAEVKSEHISNLEHSIDDGNLRIVELEYQIASLNEQNEELRIKTTELVKESEHLENIKDSLENKCSELENTGWKVVNELASKNEQLEDLLSKYNRYQEITQTKLNALEVSLMQSKSELNEMTECKNQIEWENNKQIKNLEEQIDELTDVTEAFKNREIEYVEEIRKMKNELNDNIMKYTEILQIHHELESENDFQVTSLTENLHSMVEKYNALETTYFNTLSQLRETQARLEALENTKIELEVEALKQKLQFDEDYNKCISNFNLQIQEKTERETALQDEVSKVIKKLDTSEKTYNDLQNHVTKLCGELADLKGEKAKLYHSLRIFKSACQDLKDIYCSLKDSHLDFVNSNTNSLTNLRCELVEHIDYLGTKNSCLSVTIGDLSEKLNKLTSDQELMSTVHMEKLDNKDKQIVALSKDNEAFIDQMNKMLQDKEILEQRLLEETSKVEKLDKVTTASNGKIQECQKTLMSIKCTNDILETAKIALENEILCKTDKIVELEKLKYEDQTKYAEEIDIRNVEIKTLTNKIKTLECQKTENLNKNSEILLEVYTVNQTLENLTKQYTSLQNALIEEKEDKIKKLQQAESNLFDNQSILQNLQTENDFVTKEIALAKEEISELKEQVRICFTERQTLSLQIKSANEKSIEQDSHARKQELQISELNAKLLLKLEEILELEKGKQSVQQKYDALLIELDNVKKDREEIFESQAKIIKETENHLIRAHHNAIEVKDDLMKRIEQLQSEHIKDKQLRTDLEKLLEGEKTAKEILEIRVLELVNEKFKFCQLVSSIKHNICILGSSLSEKPVEITFNNGNSFEELNMTDLEDLNKNIESIQSRILVLFNENENHVKELSELQQEKSVLNFRISDLVEENQLTLQEKQKLFDDYNILFQEKMERERDLKSFNDIQLEHSMLKAKYDQLVSYSNNNELLKTKNDALLEQIKNLERKTTEVYDVYKKYAGYSNVYKINIEKLISERTILEKVVVNLKQICASIQVKLLHINEEREKGRLMEQMYSFEIILEDIQKQFLRSSRKIHEIILMAVQVPISICDSIKSNSILLDNNIKINFDEELDGIIDCKDRAGDLLEQMTAFDECLGGRGLKTQKENVARSSNIANVDTKITDDELKKRNVILKQRLTLAENAKSNLEKKIKQLRQENKAFSESSENTFHDSSYKTLLQQHIQSKEEYEKTVSDCKNQYNKLLHEFKEYKIKGKFIPDQIKYEKDMKTEHDVKLEKEVVKLREAYGNVMSDNSRLDLENATMRKLLEDRTSRLSELKLIKEAYEKLLEENNKLNMELDTVKYKRNKDRESLFDALKNARMENKKIQEVRNEYEGKLEKMKIKMIQLYKEEIDKELQKLHSDQTEKVTLLKTIEGLKHSLKTLKLETGKSKSSDQHNSDVSVASRDSFFLNSFEAPSTKSTEIETPYNKNLLQKKTIDDRKYTTLPKQMSVIKENSVSKRNTLSCVPKHLAPNGQDLEMEDEDGDLFNNKYLADLKEGRCTVPSSGRESNISRISELAWRNSFCPPHLKSSYPAETQFSSPGQFKEDEIKLGAGDFNDSMSTRLLPFEKPRKKDFGTTSYKKPGPPTPSKNGGRVSLQSNELREVLHECNELKTPKRITPNRIKQLFMGRGNVNTKENTENQSTTPRSKRLSFFRKPK